MNVSLSIEHVISTKPNKDSLDPLAPVKTTFDFANLSLTLTVLKYNYVMLLNLL